jgi:hypothetical protein
MIDVITTFHEAGYHSYAKRMIETFDQYWPQHINLHIYAENCNVALNVSDRIKVYDLHESFPDLMRFKEKHRNNPHANGSKMKDGTLNHSQNHFKWDAVRFSNKVFVVTNCALQMNSDILIWLDADTITFTTPTDKMLEEVIPNANQYCSYLGRVGKYHSECGWVGYNLKHRINREFMSYWRNLYTLEGLFQLREYHDSYVFDVVRQKYEQEGKCHNKNLTPLVEGRKGPGHPFIASKLGTFMDHVKGKRKLDGHSKLEEVLYHKDLPYWQNILGVKHK